MAAKAVSPRSVALPAFALALGVAPACSRDDDHRQVTPTEEVRRLLAPRAAADDFLRLGGATVSATARFAAGPPDGSLDGVTTTTQLAADGAGSFRLAESNDRDGGREVIRIGPDLWVGLRYGRLTRRPAEEPEPHRFLEEAVAAPWGAWELIARAARVEALPQALVGGRKTVGFKLSKAPGSARAQPEDLPPRKWRETLVVDRLDGEVRFDDATRALLAADMQASYAMTREGTALHGELEVHLQTSAIGTTAAVVPPSNTIDLPSRPRTVPDERALLSGLRGGR